MFDLLVGLLLLATVVVVCMIVFVAFLARFHWVRRQKELQPLQMYWSGHFTKGHQRRRREWLKELGFEREEDLHIKASVPPFNIRAGKPPHYVQQLDLPAFGPNINRAVMQIFESEHVKQVARELNVPITKVELNSFVQQKMGKVHEMIKYAREDKAINTNVEAINKMEAFVKAFEELKPDDVKDDDAWSEFMRKHVGTGWENRIQFDVLLDNFGFDKKAAEALRKKEIQDDNEKKTLEQYGCRWLSKAFTGYAPKGALVDVVNLAYAMSGKRIPTKEDGKSVPIDVQIAEEIDRVRQRITDNRMFDLWIPSKLFMDAEVDDNLCWIWLESIHRAQGTKLDVLVQLPEDRELDDVAESMRSFGACTVWRDEDSQNAGAVKLAYGGDWERSPGIQGSGPAQPGRLGDPLLQREGKGRERAGPHAQVGAWSWQFLKNPMEFISEDGGWHAGCKWPLLALELVDKRVLKLQGELDCNGKKIGHSSCLGPVIAWLVWAPVVYALLAVIFVYLGATAIQLKGFQPSLPKWWWCLVVSIGLIMYLGEIHIVRLSAMSYRIKAQGWKCTPVEKFDEVLLQRWEKRGGAHEKWVTQNREWITFLIWFLWLSWLSLVRVYSFFQANTFLGTILFWPEEDEIQCVWGRVMDHAVLPNFIDIKHFIVLILFAEATHFAFGLLFSCPRRYGHSGDEDAGCNHQRWDDSRGTWGNWGRYLERDVAREVSADHPVESKTDFDTLLREYSRKGGVVQVKCRDGRKEDLDREEHQYKEEYVRIIYTKNRHAYTCWFRAEMTLSTVVANIGEACSASFLMEMLDLELSNAIKKAQKAISDASGVSCVATKETDNAAIEVRSLLDSTETVLRTSFSRILIFGVFFSGLQTHLQVTFFNVLRLMPLGFETVPVSLLTGMCSQLFTLFFVVLKVFGMRARWTKVKHIIDDYEKFIKEQVAKTSGMERILKNIERTRRRVRILACLNAVAMFMFLLVILVWLVPKFLMETFVCQKHMWNFALSINPMAGCVPDPVGDCMSATNAGGTTGVGEGALWLI